MMRLLARDAARTGLRGLALVGSALAALLGGPAVELRLAPPVSLWEIHAPRADAGGTTWSVLVHQVRPCTASVTWRADGVPIRPMGPEIALAPGEAAQIGPFHWPRPAGAISAEVIYNCGTPWGLAPLRKTAAAE